MYKILISAYACNPLQGSEEGVGWGWIKAISNYHRLWVITADFHKNDINSHLKSHPNELRNVTFIYIKNRKIHYKPNPTWKFIENSMLKPIMNISYLLWLRDAYEIGKKLHGTYKFDLVHQLTYVGFRFPGYLWKLKIPFVWGPIGGMENTPWRYLKYMGAYGAIYFTLRNIVNYYQKVLLSSPKNAVQKAGPGVIAATSGISNEILKYYGVKSHIICEVGPIENPVGNISCRAKNEELSIVWSGLHIPRKALPILLQSLEMIDAKIKWRLIILGDGPLRKKWENEAIKLNIYNKCEFKGQLPRNQAVRVMQSAHLFIITSLMELTSTVLLEALSNGLPVICPNHFGFTDVIDKECGMKIEMASMRHFKEELSKKIELIYYDEPYRRKLARGALKRVEGFTWNSKAESVNDIYERVFLFSRSGA